MRKIATALLCLVLVFGCFSTVAFAATDDGVMPRLNNVGLVSSNFNIVDGQANIVASYMGYPGITTGAKITIKLQQRSFFFWWNDVTEWVDVSDQEEAVFDHTYPVSSGTYRVIITYEISGTAGATDVLEDVIEDSY